MIVALRHNYAVQAAGTVFSKIVFYSSKDLSYEKQYKLRINNIIIININLPKSLKGC